jgi:nucleoside-diphosphate-sugar epimerase
LNILIIGHNSFIGKKYLNKVKKKNKILFVKNKFNKNDIYFLSNERFYQKYFSTFCSKVDISINFLYIFNSPDKKKINVLLIKKIIFSLKRLKVKKNIYISSVNSHKKSFYNYGKIKYLCEQYYKPLKNFIIVRPSTVIVFNKKTRMLFGGQGGKSLNLINVIIDKFFIFPIFGKGDFLHTFCFLDDLINFLSLISFRSSFNNKTINFFSGEYINYLDFIKFIMEIKQTKRINIHFPLFIFKFLGYLLKLLSSNRSLFLERLNNLMSQKIENNLMPSIRKKIKIHTTTQY